MTNQSERVEYWLRHYESRHRIDDHSARKLDYSNDRVQLQTYAQVLDGVGSVAGRRVIDAGCGTGVLAVSLAAMGAKVTAIEFVPATIQKLQQEHQHIEWISADLHNVDLLGIQPADIVTCVEVLQHLDFDLALTAMWRLVRPGGRLVISVPNADCPIVKKATLSQGANWRPVSTSDIDRLSGTLPNLERVATKTLSFNEDQRIAAYRASNWNDPVEGTPNRLITAFIRESCP